MPRNSQQVAPEVEQVEQPAEGCIFMYRLHPETGEPQRAEVNVESGSVEIMESWGWSKEPV